MNIGVVKAIRAVRASALALAAAGLATGAVAQTAQDAQGAQTAPADQAAPASQIVPDETAQEAALAASLDLPANLQIFGKANPNIRKPTAIVNDVVITGTDVDQRAAMVIGMHNLTLKPEERDQLRISMLRQLIDETLQIQEAKSNEITIEPKEIETTFNRVAKSFDKTPEQFRTWLKQIGSSERSMKRQIEGEMAWRRLLNRRVDINVSDEEANAYIERLKAAQGREEYHLYEIYLNATPDRKAEVFQGMQRLIEQMKQGTPFGYLARTYSESSTKAQDGDLGWIRLGPGILPDEMAKAVQEMQPGQVAGPIELPLGFTVVYLAEKRQVGMADPKEAKLTLRQLTIAFPKGITEAQASERAAQFGQATQAMKGCGDVNTVAAAQNAEVIEKDGVVIKELPGALQNLILPLQVGQATQPFGTIEDGVRVLVVCGRDDPPPPGLPSAEQVQDQLVEQRTNIRAQRMLRDLRRDALVEYR